MREAERIRYDLDAVRADLVEEIGRVPSELAEWAPKEGMRTYRGQLLEIGVTERQIHGLIEGGVKPDWQPLFHSLEASGDGLTDILAVIEQDRAQTLATLRTLGDAGLEDSVKLPNSWHDRFGVSEISKAGLFRWILQHEYYHLGQIVIYNWFRGDDPYKR